MSVRDLFVRKIYTFKGISVCVEVDYVRRTVSLVEKDGDDFKRKNWYFSDRELMYMNGWLTILEAMKYAITEAKKLLEIDDSHRINELAKLLLALDSPLEPPKDKKGK